MLINNKKKVYDAIRHRLLVGELKPGTRLSETTLAKEIGVSRTPVREALNQLGRDGLVESTPYTGTYVKKLSYEEVSELFDLREMLEGYATERAARRINEVQLDELRKNCLMMASLNREIIAAKIETLEGPLALRWRVCDLAFHSSLIAAANSPRINGIIRDFHILTNLCLNSPRDKSIKLHDDIVRVVRDHDAIVAALEKQDGKKAASRMHSHIREGKRQTLINLDPQGQTKSSKMEFHDSVIEKILGY